MSAQEDLDRATVLIRQQRYTEARTLLQPLNHPDAQAWLVFLNQIAPPLTAVPVMMVKEKPRGLQIFAGLGMVGLVVMACLLIVACVGGMVAGLAISSNDTQSETETLVTQNDGYGTAAQPIPVGTWAKFQQGQVRVTRLDLDATAEVEAMDERNPPPTENHRYVMVYFEVNCKNPTCAENELNLRLVDTTGERWGEPFFVTLEPQLGKVFEDGRSEGWQVFEVPIERTIESLHVAWFLSESLVFELPTSE